MRIFLIVACLLFLDACSDQVVESSLVERLGVIYKINSQLPFTGVVPNYHNSGQLKSATAYIDGKQDGLEKHYYQVEDDSPEAPED
jgi:antitoxin component YwqK of YwqJK toxin-antitoxin module